jgi:hypothetical protein
MMKLTIEFEGRTIVLDRDDVVDICDVLALMEEGLIECGYDRNRIDAAIEFWANQIKEGRSWDS